MKQLFAGLCLLGLMAVPVSADSGFYDCTVVAGASVVAFSLNTGDEAAGAVHVGGCTLAVVETDSVVRSVSAAEGCTVQADLDGDNLADVAAEPGTVVPAGGSVVAFCDAGVVDAYNSVTL